MIIVTKLLTAMTAGQTIGDINNRILDSIQRKNFGRVLTSAGWVGSAGAAADGAIEHFEDLNSLYKNWNAAADGVINRDRVVGLEAYIPAKHKYDFECIDAMSNTFALHLSFLEQRPGESLVGKIQGAETTLFENLGTLALDQGEGMQATKELGYHMVDENNDRFVSWVSFLGSSALNDSGIEFTVDGDFRGCMWNQISTTKTLLHNSWLPANIYIPKGATFDISCLDAFAADAHIGLKILKLTDSAMAPAVEAAKPEDI